MGYNSTIILKKRPCISCGADSYIFSKGRCQDCARIEDSMKRIDQSKGDKGEDLSGLIHDADTLFSIYVRRKDANKQGEVACYTCGTVKRYQELQCGHYMKRGNLFLRWDLRNARVQCYYCNVTKGGNAREFSLHLEREYPGITEILLEESRLVYKPSRDEMRNLVSELTQKIKRL